MGRGCELGDNGFREKGVGARFQPVQKSPSRCCLRVQTRRCIRVSDDFAAAAASWFGRGSLVSLPPFQQHQYLMAQIAYADRSIFPLNHQFGRSSAVVNNVRDCSDAPILIAHGVANHGFLTGAIGHTLFDAAASRKVSNAHRRAKLATRLRRPGFTRIDASTHHAAMNREHRILSRTCFASYSIRSRAFAKPAAVLIHCVSLSNEPEKMPNRGSSLIWERLLNGDYEGSVIISLCQ